MSFKLVVASAAIAACAGAASAAPLFFDDFESYEQGAPGSISPTWTVVEGSVDVIGTPGPYPWYPTQQIDMNGSGGDSTAAVIFTSITGFVIDQLYTLSFDYGSNKNSNGDEVLNFFLVGPTLITSLYGTVTSSGEVADLISYSFTFTAKDTVLDLYFEDGQAYAPFEDDNDQGGPIIDNVSVEAIAPVPLPAAAPLMLVALGGLALIRRRRKA